MSTLDAETRLADLPSASRADLRLWLRLFACTSLIEAEVRSRLRQEFDVTLPRFDLMAQLERAPDGLTPAEISQRMMVTAANTTGLVDTLVEHGLVVRQPHASDGRRVLVMLTDEGRAAFARMARAHAGWIADLFAPLAAEDRDQLLDLLNRLKSSVRERLS